MRIAAKAVVALAVSGFVAGCAGDQGRMGTPTEGGRIAMAPLSTAAGVAAGRATAREVTGGLRVTIDAVGMPPGTHGAHIHTTGVCAAPDFMTAGGHWNPTGASHGSMNPAGPHEGDLPNIVIGADGRGTIGITIPGGSIDGLLDADGGALIVHAAADDLMTDPSGNSGARIACGVFSLG